MRYCSSKFVVALVKFSFHLIGKTKFSAIGSSVNSSSISIQSAQLIQFLLLKLFPAAIPHAALKGLHLEQGEMA